MNSFLLYLFQVSLIFGSFYLLFKWLFSKFTFHAVNRSLLLLIIPLSLLLPFSAELFPEVQQLMFDFPLVEDFTAFTSSEYFTSASNISNNQPIDFGFWIVSIYTIGVLCCLTRFVITTYSLFKLKNNAQKIESNGVTLYAADVSEVFSYFNWIFIPNPEATSFDLSLIHI